MTFSDENHDQIRNERRWHSGRNTGRRVDSERSGSSDSQHISLRAKKLVCSPASLQGLRKGNNIAINLSHRRTHVRPFTRDK